MIPRIVSLFVASFVLTSLVVQQHLPDNKMITFIKVDLVCGAASDMGCGSRSKPILIDLENQPEIAEAWLNRPGTVIAVIWNEAQDADQAILRPTLKKHGKSGKVLDESEAKSQEVKFRSERWYRTEEVDELSSEEAGRIAESIMDVLVSQGLIGEDESSEMESEVEAFIKSELLSLEDVSLLDQRSYYKGWESGVKEIARAHMPEANVHQIRLFGWSPWITYSIYGGIALVTAIVFVLGYRYRRKRLNKPKLPLKG